MLKNRLILAFFIVVAGAFATYRGGRVSYAFFSLTLLLPLSSLSYMLYVYLRFRIYQTVDAKTTVKGDWLSYTFSLCNEDVLAYTHVKVEFFREGSSIGFLEKSPDFCLLPGQSSNRTTSLCCHYRGEYEVGIESVVISDYLRLFTARYHPKSHIWMRVYPKIVLLHNPVFALPREDDKYASFALRTADGMADSECREYEPGDPLNKIHQKASARFGKAMTRKVSPFTHAETLLFVDASRPDADPSTRLKIEDKVLECALAATHYFYRKQTKVKLFMEASGGGRLISNKESFYDFYHFCKDVSFQDDCRIGRLLSHHLPYLPSHRPILCITHGMDHDLQYACHRAVSHGVDVRIIYVGNDFESLSCRLDGRIQLFPIHWEQDVTEVLES